MVYTLENGQTIELSQSDEREIYQIHRKRVAIDCIKDYYYDLDDSFEHLDDEDFDNAFENFDNDYDNNDAFWDCWWEMIRNAAVDNLPFKEENEEINNFQKRENLI